MVRLCAVVIMINTKSRCGKCTWTPPHAVFFTGQLVEYMSCRDEITFDLFKMTESNTRVVNGKNMYYSW